MGYGKMRDFLFQVFHFLNERSTGVEFSSRSVFLQTGETQIIYLVIKITLLPGTLGFIKERSSMARNGAFVFCGVTN